MYALIFHDKISTPHEFDEQVAGLKMKQFVTERKKYTPKNYGDDNYRPYDDPAPGSDPAPTKKSTLFYFDPNTLPAEGWKRLGLRDKTIATIRNYIAKGGKFRQPGDIKKVWGLFPDEAERLMPYIQITNTPGAPPAGKANREYNNIAPGYKKATAVVSINESDTAALIALPGIGNKLSQRIVNFRTRLGGFHSIEQVGETFGLPDSTFQKIKPFLRLSGEVKKLDLNTATLDELKTHPYIRYELANAIMQYKRQHGDYQSVDDIKRIMIVTEELFNKVSPYLAVD